MGFSRLVSLFFSFEMYDLGYFEKKNICERPLFFFCKRIHFAPLIDAEVAETTEAYFEPSQTSEVEVFASIVNGFQPFHFYKKHHHRFLSGF